MPRDQCRDGGPTLPNGNCTNPGPDDLPVQCIGPWSTDKHDYIERYISATRGVRAKYIAPIGSGGAAFIDLFAGPGIARVRTTGEIRRGSPLIALAHEEAPFSPLILCESDPSNLAALQERTRADAGRVRTLRGDCNQIIDEIAAHIPAYGLNIALIDPFALRALKFSTIERLALFPRMDLIIHFPTGDIKRNLRQLETSKRWLTEALGTDEWEGRMKTPTDIATVIDIFKSQLVSLGYGSQEVRAEAIRNSQNLILYYLVYASKSERGDSIWRSIIKNRPTGQRAFDF